MLLRQWSRLLHTSKSLAAAVSTSPLAVLRKKTGYSFTNCKKALEIHANDVTKAEEWLHSQAKAEGWAKVAKLQDRTTAQGLVGLVRGQSTAAMVEVNCETDFVARNQRFQELVACVADSSLKTLTSNNQSGFEISKKSISAADLNTLRSDDGGQTLADVVAVNVGLLGENIALRRAVCVRLGPDLHVSGYTHPPVPSVNGVSTGRYGAIVVFRKLRDTDVPLDVSMEEVGKQLCQHVVGMNPMKIGSNKDKPANDKDEETCLLLQEFLLDPDVLVHEFLDQNGLEIVDFNRFECGEKLTTEQ